MTKPYSKSWKTDKVVDLLSKPFEDLMDIAMRNLTSEQEEQLVLTIDVFHDKFHQLGWGSDCGKFMRMMAVVAALCNGYGAAAGGQTALRNVTFSKESLKYVMSAQAPEPEDIYDGLPSEERRSYEELCRFAIEKRIRLTMLDREAVTPDTFFTATMDTLMFFRQMQEHAMNAEKLAEFIVFDEET